MCGRRGDVETCQGCGEPCGPEGLGETRCTDCGKAYRVCGACPRQLCDACLDASLPLFGGYVRLLVGRAPSNRQPRGCDGGDDGPPACQS